MVLADTSKGDIGWKKWLIAGWAFMECLLFGGLLYGWGSIEFVLKEEGIYADLCAGKEHGGNENSSIIYSNVTIVPPNATVNLGYTIVPEDMSTSNLPVPGNYSRKPCKPQDSKMALCFTIGSVMFCVGCAVLGHVSYKCGTRITRLISL